MEQDTTKTPIFVYYPSPSSEMEVLTSAALVCSYLHIQFNNLIIYKKFVSVGKIIMLLIQNLATTIQPILLFLLSP